MQTAKPVIRVATVKEPSKPGEFEIQARLYSELRALGINIRGEVKAHYSTTGTRFDKKANCRFDLAEFVNGQLAGIIEVKATKVKHKTDAGWHGTRQGTRYSNYGVPLLIVYGMEEAEKTISSAQQHGRVPYTH